MATKKYILPLVEVTKCEPINALMEFSNPTPKTTPGEKEYAPKRKVY